MRRVGPYQSGPFFVGGRLPWPGGCRAKPFGQGSVIDAYSTKTTTSMESLSDNAQPSNFITDPDQADTKYSTDGAETSMVKLVDGKLVAMGNTHDDVTDDQILGRSTGSDEERGLQGQEGTQYEKSAAALRGTDVIDPGVMPEDPMAEAEITGNPDAGYTVESGLPSEDAPVTTSTEADTTANDRVQPNGSDLPSTQTFSVNMMMPQIDPSPAYPNPSVPDAPQPVAPTPGNPSYPEFPEIPGTPSAPQPEIQEPTEPGMPQPSGPERIGFVTYTSSVGGSVSPDDDIEAGKAVPGNQYEGLSAGIDANEGMKNQPDTGRSARPYNADAKDDDSYLPGERPNEAAQMQHPHGPVDESSVMEENMLAGTDRTETKSTDGL